MKSYYAFLLMLCFVSASFGFELIIDTTSVIIDVGSIADFELLFLNPDRMVDTVDIELHKDLPDGWSGTGCTPYECFYEHAVYVSSGPDTAEMTTHINANSENSGTMAMVYTSRVTGQIDSIIFDVTATSSVTEHKIPEEIECTVFPNPFNANCCIDYNIENSGKIAIYDEIGRNVFDKNISGSGSINWCPDNLPGGMYIIRILSSENEFERRLFYLK